MSIFQKVFNAHEKEKGVHPTTDDGTNEYTAEVMDDVRRGQNAAHGIEWISEYHVCCGFLLDTSGSMNWMAAIQQLVEGVRKFKEQTLSQNDQYAAVCIDVAIVTVGPDVRVYQDFKPVRDMEVPELTANGETPLGEGINKMLDMIEAQKRRYEQIGTPHYRPWLFCLTDGKPTDEYTAAMHRLKRMEAAKGVLGYCVGVENYDKQVVTSIFDPKRVYQLENLNFPSLFEFLSNSLCIIRNSDPISGGTITSDAPADLHRITLEY